MLVQILMALIIPNLSLGMLPIGIVVYVASGIRTAFGAHHSRGITLWYFIRKEKNRLHYSQALFGLESYTCFCQGTRRSDSYALICVSGYHSFGEIRSDLA